MLLTIAGSTPQRLIEGFRLHSSSISVGQSQKAFKERWGVSSYFRSAQSKSFCCKTKVQDFNFKADRCTNQMAAASNVIPLGLLHMRPLQWELKTRGFSPEGKPVLHDKCHT